MQMTPEQELLAGVPYDGTTIGNVSLRRALAWSSDRYLSVRNTLVDAGLLTLGGGKGGSVRRVVIDPDPPVVFTKELDLHGPMSGDRAPVGARAWRHTDRGRCHRQAGQGGHGRHLDATGHHVRRATDIRLRPGNASRPKARALTTFEVKRARTLDVRAVFEAVAHRRAATEVYVLVHTPYGVAEDDFTRVMNVAAAEEVGFITADDPSDFDTWDERVAPERIQTDPALLDAFIRKQLPETDRAAIASAVSGL